MTEFTIFEPRLSREGGSGGPRGEHKHVPTHRGPVPSCEAISGRRGDDPDLVKVHGPPNLIEAVDGFPFIVLAPQCPEDADWVPVELSDLLHKVIAKYRVEEDRIYLTGLSMGGDGTWATSLAAATEARQ